MNWPDRSGKIKPEEFLHPDKMDPRLVEVLGEIRIALDAPMWFTLRAGQPRHPNGDAVPPDAGSHKDFSLHKWGIDHDLSFRLGKIIPRADQPGLAVDFDTDAATTDEDLFRVYEKLLSFDLGGIGLYPQWNNRGFHVDLRDEKHPTYGARWFRWNGIYRPIGEYPRVVLESA